MFKNIKIRNKILFSVLSINVIMFLIIFVCYYNFSKRAVIKETKLKAIEKVNSVAKSLDGYLIEKAKTAWTFSEIPMVKSWLKTNDSRFVTRENDLEYAKIIDFLKELVKNDGEINSAFIASEKVQMYYDSEERQFPEDYIEFC